MDWPPAAADDACLVAVQMTVDAVKQRINTMTGTSLHTMVLHLKDSSGRLVAVLEDSSKKLGYYSPEHG
jgi:tubulin-folding cofactor B